MLITATASRAAFVDAVLAEVGTGIITASDVGLARALGAHGLAPSGAAIGPEEVQRLVQARLLVREAEQLEIGVPADAVDRAWQAVAERRGGLPALAAWLERIGVSQDWARRVVTDDLRRARYVEVRFREFAFVSEFEVDEALGPGEHAEPARDAVRRRLLEAEVQRSLDEWLAETRERVQVKLLMAAPVPVPFEMP
ncbi:MAG: hypothetical protein ACE147_02170 [Candidatus Methylomirabilales bacterium]